jgi:hypothetical protein
MLENSRVAAQLAAFQDGLISIKLVSYWKPGIPGQVRSCGICGGQSGTASSFLRVLRLLVPIIHHTGLVQ